MSKREAPVLSVYDPRWADRFAGLAARACAALGSLVTRVEHVGSTAVDGLDALPIVDLDMVVAHHQDLAPAIDLLAALGYQHEGDRGIAVARRFAGRPARIGTTCTCSLRAPTSSCATFASETHCGAQPRLRDDYASLKRSLAARHPGDRAAYKLGKAGFIEAALARSGASR